MRWCVDSSLKTRALTCMLEELWGVDWRKLFTPQGSCYFHAGKAKTPIQWSSCWLLAFARVHPRCNEGTSQQTDVLEIYSASCPLPFFQSAFSSGLDWAKMLHWSQFLVPSIRWKTSQAWLILVLLPKRNTMFLAWLSTVFCPQFKMHLEDVYFLEQCKKKRCLSWTGCRTFSDLVMVLQRNSINAITALTSLITLCSQWFTHI